LPPRIVHTVLEDQSHSFGDHHHPRGRISNSAVIGPSPGGCTRPAHVQYWHVQYRWMYHKSVDVYRLLVPIGGCTRPAHVQYWHVQYRWMYHKSVDVYRLLVPIGGTATLYLYLQEPLSTAGSEFKGILRISTTVVSTGR
jgi:hypothetical protein